MTRGTGQVVRHVGGVVGITVLVGLVISLWHLKKEVLLGKSQQSMHMMRNKSWYAQKFPELEFETKPSKADVYANQVRSGLAHMKRKKMVLCGLARDIGAVVLFRTLHTLEAVGRCFADFRVIIFENDSSDDTRQFLLAAANSRPWMEIMRCPEDFQCCLSQTAASSDGYHSMKRMQKMAHFRNRCLERAKEVCGDFDYYSVMDLDLGGPVSIDGLATCFADTGREFDCVSANGLVGRVLTNGTKLMYYDSLAKVDYGKTGPKLDTLNIMAHHVSSYFQKTLVRGDPWVRVKSGFGGFAIYAFPPIVANNLVYDGNGCEHVRFNEKLSNLGYDRHYINPNFMLLHVMCVDTSLI